MLQHLPTIMQVAVETISADTINNKAIFAARKPTNPLRNSFAGRFVVATNYHESPREGASVAFRKVSELIR